MIPSKGRAGKTKTTKILDASLIDYTLVVEPQDEAEYKKQYDCDIIVLPKNNQGITYARKYILDMAKNADLEWFWMMDDDINGFGEVVAGKTKKRNAEVLFKAESLFSKHKSSLYSLELTQFAWSSAELKKNRVAMQCILFNVPLCKNIDYDLNIQIREDYDLTFQAIFKGYGTLRSAKYFYSIAAMKSQKGGMESFYNEEKEKQEVIKLCRKYPKLVEPVYKKNRHDVKINWRKFKL